jgi:cytidylate kinase
MQTADLGQLFRERAIAKWLTIAEYDTLVEANPQEDVEMDKYLQHIVESCSGDIIVSRRMWFHLLPNIISIRLDVSPEQWAQRVFLADRGKQEPKYASVQEALEANQDRMAKLKQRLLSLYDVDFTDIAHYTKIIDTTDKSFDQVLQEFEEYIETLKK